MTTVTSRLTPAEAEIAAVIEEETAAWLRGDFEGWAACWVQDERAQHTIARPSVGARIMYGFEEVVSFFRPEFEDLAAHPPPTQEVRRENWRFSIGTDMAWATFDQIRPASDRDNTAPGRHNQMRILERVEGAWKIAALFQIPNRLGYYKNPWVEVDSHGRVAQLGLGAEALLSSHPSLGLVGGRLVARRPGGRDRLAQALTLAQDRIERRVGRPPLPLVLSEVDDETVSLCWISIADMMIVVLLGDESLLTDAIDRAGDVYRLSPAQKRVAEAIARGNDLSAIARALGVQPSTIRTHVRRMFERVEVNSQPALIRALLSVDAPKL